MSERFKVPKFHDNITVGFNPTEWTYYRLKCGWAVGRLMTNEQPRNNERTTNARSALKLGNNNAQGWSTTANNNQQLRWSSMVNYKRQLKTTIKKERKRKWHNSQQRRALMI